MTEADRRQVEMIREYLATYPPVVEEMPPHIREWDINLQLAKAAERLNMGYVWRRPALKYVA